MNTVDALRRYPWTGHAVLMGSAQRAWQPVEEVLAHWGADRSAARAAYERFVEEGWTLGAQPHLCGGGLIRSLGGQTAGEQARRAGADQAYDERILGSGGFVKGLLRHVDAVDHRRLAWPGYQLQDLLEATAGLLGLVPTQLTSQSRDRKVCQGKALVIYTGREWLGRALQELAELTHMSSGCASRAWGRGRRLAGQLDLAEALKRQKGSYVP
ncbi:MAG: hypothetical protein HYZ73_00555 [Elusimicrobia bacterium]|nr:hypothetical protein [Elusimicrobiota bacterium]